MALHVTRKQADRAVAAIHKPLFYRYILCEKEEKHNKKPLERFKFQRLFVNMQDARLRNVRDRIKKPSIPDGFYYFRFRKNLDSSGHFIRTKATGAGVYVAGSAINNRLNTLHIGFPSSIGSSVRVRNLNSERDTLAADIALSHMSAPPYGFCSLSQRKYLIRLGGEKQEFQQKKYRNRSVWRSG